ncbi:MAG: Lrp/AsnC family transcriptional regulator [Candidatus Thorarchaeota archaeon]|jgi:DNA-binding Lrp family transcriptional regulator
MDQLDKSIVAHLLTCSRRSFRSIADNLGVSCPTVKKRVERLRQFGVIQRFSVELAQETLGTRYVAAEIKINGGGEKRNLLQQFDDHECIREVGIESTRVSYINQIPSNTVEGQCKFAKKGERVELTEEQLEILWYLVRNSRIPVKMLSRQTGYTIKRVRHILREILENPGVHITTQLNLISSGDINFLLSVDCERITTPEKIANQLCKRFPQEHWFSMNTIDRNSLLSYMTARDLGRVEQVIDATSMNQNIYNVDAKIVYNVLKSEGRSEKFIRDFALDRIEGVPKNGRKRFSGF